MQNYAILPQTEEELMDAFQHEDTQTNIWVIDNMLKLREESPKAEKKLGKILSALGLSVIHQAPFIFQSESERRIYFADYYDPIHGLVFEADGLSHISKESKESDARRDADFLSVGIKTIRIHNDNINLINLRMAECVCQEEKVERKKISKGVKSKDGFSEDVEKIYDAYPSQCKISGRRTQKCKRDKEMIKRILKEGVNANDIVSAIQLYISECVSSTIYICNFGKFLTHYLQNYMDIDEQ